MNFVDNVCVFQIGNLKFVVVSQLVNYAEGQVENPAIERLLGSILAISNILFVFKLEVQVLSWGIACVALYWLKADSFL